MDISLNQSFWELKGYYPWVPLLNQGMETGLELKGVTDWMPATVPGGVHFDLYKAGYIEHPHWEMNSIKCEWVEHRWWLYKTSFARPERSGRKVELVCKGLDYKAILFMNGAELGEHEGMFHPAIFDITAFVQKYEVLELEILFQHAPDEMSQIGKTSQTHTQKSRFNYKWDFSTRMVNVGIWDDVLLKIYEDYSIEDLSVHTDVINKTGKIDVVATMRRSQLSVAQTQESCGLVQVSCKDPNGHIIASQEVALFTDQSIYSFSIPIENPELWYPNGHGEQPLYELCVQFTGDGNIYDERVLQIGIRKLRYDQNVNSPADALPYTFVINDKKIYIKGVNMTPLDLLYGNVSIGHYEWFIYMMKKANVNMVRVWGGGIIEKKQFYGLCDRHGIMIWQEFIQSSSGHDNIPSKRPEFLKLLEKTAVTALKDRRNHVSLTVWSGGNELMSAANQPSTYEDENIAMLKQLVEQYDPLRLFLPTSASGPVEFITAEKGISHDVHGQWKYMGNPGHYELYGQSDNLFHSEFGVDGMSSVKSLRKFLSEPLITPRSMDDDLIWRHHGEWWDTLARDENIFGPMQNMAMFSLCSQWIQAEGLRFIVETNRRRKFANSGSIIWQLNEPWPNVSCTCLVDYYGDGKMAYYWTRKAFAPLHVSLDYHRLQFAEGERFEGSIYVHGNGNSGQVSVRARVLDLRGTALFEQSFSGNLAEEQALEIGILDIEVSASFGKLFFVHLHVSYSEAVSSENLYIFSMEKENFYAPALELKGARLEVETSENWKMDQSEISNGVIYSRTYSIRNTGNQAALHVYPEEMSNAFWMDANGSFETIFPEESKSIKVLCVRKHAGGFLSENQILHSDIHDLPIIDFKHFAE